MSVRTKAWGPFAVLIGCLLPMLGTMPAQASEKNCASQISGRQLQEENRIDKKRAVALAKADQDFGHKTKGHKAELSSIYFVHSFDPKTCAYKGLDSVNLVYGLSKADKHVKNVVAHVDAKLSGLKTVSEHETDRGFVLDHTSKGWSGYVAAALKNSGTAQETLSTANVQWTVPKISTPDVDDISCVGTSCDVAAWVGLYGVYDETSGSSSAQLAQTGSTSVRKCSWVSTVNWMGQIDIDLKCSNQNYLWYEFLPAAAVKCTNAGTVSAGDSISAEVKKRRYANTYVLTVSNLTTGKSCSVSQEYSMSNPVFAAFIFEPPVATGSGTSTTLPKFSTTTMTNAGVSWYRTEGLVQYDLYYMATRTNQAAVVREKLYQGSAQNISVGNITSGGNFTQTYLTSAK